MDYRLTWDDVLGEFEATTVGRPHIADALVAAGYFVDRRAAFADVLHPRSKYYVPTYALDTLDAIRLVRSAGGFSGARASRRRAAAHADTSRRGAGNSSAQASRGSNSNHPENREDWLPPLREAADELGLTVTGGE
ncbi:hypothetical protein [Leucobacter aridicollis]|uniref:hypothetical protein n=1 Tax=Leucobacter aridicollis TaxID=283878 RepID=UPI002104AACB|nr:hypothetical protein [Leucobacter aridicollis]